MILGFTGTHLGMTTSQETAVRQLFNTLPLHVLHHGDCVGADSQAHRMARYLRARIVIHPPTDTKLRAFCSNADEVVTPFPYLQRDFDIARAGINGLIATPSEDTEIVRSGTWATIRYARTLKRHIWIVKRDGTIEQEYHDGKAEAL